MITIWVPKRLVEIDLYNVAARSPQALADLSEQSYAQRVDYAAQKVQLSGAKIVMLTGDSPKTAAAIAAQVGVDEFLAGVLPADKAEFVSALRRNGHTVIMVGDGINDSPALSEADAGVAVSGGAAIAREVADITIAGGSLWEIVKLRRIAMALMSRIRANYRFVIGFNASLIALGVAGVLQPSASAMLHNLSTLGVSLHSMSALPAASEKNG